MPVSTPGLQGHFRITAACDSDGRTYLARQDVRSPWHLSKPYWNGDALTVQVINATAGMLEGDDLELRVEAGPDTRLCITSPSASRAYTMRGGSAVCRQWFTAGGGAALDVFPEPLFPHARTRYRQETVCSLTRDCQVFLAEQIAPGRAARGETWAWERLDILTEVRMDGKLILAERLAGSGAELGALAARHGFTEAWFGTAVIAAPDLQNDEGWLAALRELHQPRSGVWAGVSRLTGAAPAWIFKTTAATAPLLRETMRSARSILSPAIPMLGADLRKSPQ
ncbi:MAG: Urease accessory protein UreD [Verrucomicrobiales bacterium]|nr:Urease accessory protein UreD [Verrucomicrobiales bacterium]